MPARINQAIDLLEQDQPIYYAGGHTGHVLTYEQGRADAQTWADYINVGMEHGAFDMAGPAAYMRGLVDGGPTESGHRTPAVIVEAPVNGTDEANVRFNAWQFRQILAAGCTASCSARRRPPAPCAPSSSRAATRTSWRASIPSLPSPLERLRGAPVEAPARRRPAAARAWAHAGAARRTPRRRSGASRQPRVHGACDPWPLNPRGELLLGVKLESPEGVANCEEILAVPGLGFAEIGPGDLGLSLGYTALPRDPYPPEMQEARERIFAACRAERHRLPRGRTPETIAARIDEGVRVVAGHSEETARAGRAHQQRAPARGRA